MWGTKRRRTRRRKRERRWYRPLLQLCTRFRFVRKVPHHDLARPSLFTHTSAPSARQCPSRLLLLCSLESLHLSPPIVAVVHGNLQAPLVAVVHGF